MKDTMLLCGRVCTVAKASCPVKTRPAAPESMLHAGLWCAAEALDALVTGGPIRCVDDAWAPVSDYTPLAM